MSVHPIIDIDGVETRPIIDVDGDTTPADAHPDTEADTQSKTSETTPEKAADKAPDAPSAFGEETSRSGKRILSSESGPRAVVSGKTVDFTFPDGMDDDAKRALVRDAIDRFGLDASDASIEKALQAHASGATEKVRVDQTLHVTDPGHKFLVVGNQIIDPTFAQFLDKNSTKKDGHEPFVGTYEDMVARLASEGIADPEGLLAKQWGLQKPAKPGERPGLDAGVVPFKGDMANKPIAVSDVDDVRRLMKEQEAAGIPPGEGLPPHLVAEANATAEPSTTVAHDDQSALASGGAATGDAPRKQLDAQQLAELRAQIASYAESDEFRDGTRPKGAEGTPDGIEIWGDPSRPLPFAPGHIAATSTKNDRDHSSFGPARETVAEARAAALRDGNVHPDLAAPRPRRLERMGAGRPPLDGAELVLVTRVQAELFPNRGADPFDRDGNHDFSHVFHPSFIDPVTFARVVAGRRADMDQLLDPDFVGPAALYDPDLLRRLQLSAEYQLMGVPLDVVEGFAGFHRTTPGRDKDLDVQAQRDLGRVQNIPDPTTGQTRAIAPARNCATDLLEMLHQMGVVGEQDFRILGADESGHFLPENDLTPQALYTLLRWRERAMLAAKGPR